MIHASDLSKRYPNGHLALDALNLKVAQGEIYCLLGAKGAGKTTTINLFLGSTEPTAGRALIDRIDVAREPLRAKQRAAYLGEGMAFYGRLSARRNLEYLARLGGRTDLTADDYDMAMREAGLPESMFRQRASELGPGMTRKLGVAAALLKGAPALLLDEPLSGLDPKGAAEIVELMESLRDRGKALLLTMQDLVWVRQLADFVGILQEGRQVLTRNRDELRYENLEKLYLDTVRGGPRQQPSRT
jgi:ABC-2 type transport system ATP-binding protein